MRAVIVLLVAIAAICVIVAPTATEAYKLKPTFVRLVGRSWPGMHFWKPTRAVKFADGVGAVRVSLSPDDCHEESECKHAAAFTADGGNTWSVDKEMTDFCGSAGVVEEGKVRCVGQQVDKDGDDAVLTFEQYEYEIVPGEQDQPPKMVARKHEKHTTFAHPGFEPTAMKFGDQVVSVPEKQAHLRNVEVTHANGTVTHAFYSSADGHHWEFVSEVPFPFGLESSMQRIGESKIVLLSGKPGNYTQAQSIYLGRRWEKIEPTTLPTPLSSYISPYYTTIYGGVRGRPGIYAMAIGAGKKGSEKPIDIVNFHNRLNGKEGAPENVQNFTEEYLNATNFACLDKPHSASHADGCHSSSYANVLQLANDTIIMLYDQLFNGWNAPTEDAHSNVYAMKLHLDESKEQRDLEERIAEAARRKKQEEEYEAARKQAHKDREERKRKERREKLRKDKERRAQFAERDVPFIEAAKVAAAEDGEMVVVRDVDLDFLDVEKDVF